MRYVKLIFILLLIAVLMWLFFQNVNFAEVIAIIGDVDPIYPLAFAMGIMGQFLLRGYRWGIILKAHKSHISLLTLYKFTAIGFFLNLLPGKVGEPAKGILLAQRENIRRSYGLASVVLERLIDSFTIILIFLLSLLLMKPNNSPFLAHLRGISLYLLPVTVVLFLLIYLINSERVFVYLTKVIRFLAKILPQRVRQRGTDFVLNFVRGLKLQLKFTDYFRLFFASLATWVFVIPFYWFLMKGFAIEMPMLETTAYFGVVVASAAIPTPGMAGSLDAGSRIALTRIFDVPAATAVAYTMLFHFLILVLTVVIGLWAFWMEGLNVKAIRDIRKQKNEVSRM